MFLVDLCIVPNAPRSRVEATADGYKVRINAPPVDGAANARLVEFLAREVFGVARSKVSVVRGERGRVKTVAVDLEPADAESRLRAAAQER